MQISILVAVTENGVIGKDNKLQWRLSNDLKRFKELTSGHHILMGRKTYESLPKTLPNRKHIIISRNKSFQAPDENCWIFDTIEGGIEFARNNSETELFIIGGAEIYQQCHSIADCIYLTTVHAKMEGDSYFPQHKRDKKWIGENWRSDWTALYAELTKADEKNEYDFTFEVLKRKQP